MSFFLEITDINKQIDERKILDNFNLNISKATIHALLGPNGAGKTSLLKIILGISKPSSGTITLDGELIQIPYTQNIRRKIGFLPDEPILTNQLTGFENIKYMNHIYDNPKNDLELKEILEQNGLGDSRNKLVKDYSKGMKQRLSLCITELYTPSLLILDEPTIGLDIVGISNLKNKLKTYRSQGCTILLTTHDIHFCQEIADDLTLINHGKNIDGGLTSDWLNSYSNIEMAMIDKLKLKEETHVSV
ncbi:ABC-2 type transport system ATP-binding protein [Cytobacillus firmus]|uniref:ABC-2 type transport system ATP-binding protein n=2 Tax=Cytobacillus TaxID=2675230 RepID=A0A366JXZ4_CYTFI|nr:MULTISPECIES: ABC transporter ATP-binding protein [Cytobacillus]RBP94389.1 ABC-2 type transport system ATP-binding protein [Cytobacillus firmus]TDX43136.1 ABC-2 type transport system ATP-binding protein [Cytobacillus oceanisediminis]